MPEPTYENPPSIGVFKTNMPLQIMPYPNGGWVIEQSCQEPGRMAVAIGAYSNAKDMLEALSKALTP